MNMKSQDGMNHRSMISTHKGGPKEESERGNLLKSIMEKERRGSESDPMGKLKSQSGDYKKADDANPKNDHIDMWSELKTILQKTLESGPGYGGIEDPGPAYWSALRSVVSIMGDLEADMLSRSAGKTAMTTMDEYWKTLDEDDKRYIAEQAGLNYVRNVKKHGPIAKEDDIRIRQEAVKDIVGASEWSGVPIRWRQTVREYRYENQLEVGSLGKAGAIRREKYPRKQRDVEDNSMKRIQAIKELKRVMIYSDGPTGKLKTRYYDALKENEGQVEREVMESGKDIRIYIMDAENYDKDPKGWHPQIRKELMKKD